MLVESVGRRSDGIRFARHRRNATPNDGNASVFSLGVVEAGPFLREVARGDAGGVLEARRRVDSVSEISVEIRADGDVAVVEDGLEALARRVECVENVGPFWNELILILIIIFSVICLIVIILLLLLF